MQINPDVFKAFAKGHYPIAHLSTLEQYYYCKAHKLANTEHFERFWTSGRSKDPLRAILKAFYPPLEFCHSVDEGFPDLSSYVAVASPILGGL